MPARKIVPLTAKTQISATGEAWTANSVLDFSSVLPADQPIDSIIVGMYGDNVTDEALLSEIVNELYNKIYLKETGLGGIIDMSGADYLAALKLVFGLPDIPLFGDVTNDAERFCAFPLLFQHPAVPTTGLPPRPAGRYTLQVTLGTSSNIDGADYQLFAVRREGVTPTEVVTMLTQNYVPSTTGVPIKVRLRERGRCAGILLYGTTIRTTIQSVNVLINDREIDFKATDLVFKAVKQIYSRYGDWIGKHAIYEKVPSAATDNGPASLPAAVENLKDLMRYTYLDFGDPDGWPTVEGVKFELEITAGNTNAIRIIPVELLPVA
jgi:hypothetical protein